MVMTAESSSSLPTWICSQRRWRMSRSSGTLVEALRAAEIATTTVAERGISETESSTSKRLPRRGSRRGGEDSTEQSADVVRCYLPGPANHAGVVLGIPAYIAISAIYISRD